MTDSLEYLLIFFFLVFTTIIGIISYIKRRSKLPEKEKDLLELLNIFLQVVEANKGTAAGDDDRILDAEGLALKFYGHALSALYLWRGVNILDSAIPIQNFPDPSSLDVLVRAAFEAYLVFYYVFLNPDSEEELDFRFYSWEIAGLSGRQNYLATTEENIKKLQDESDHIKKLMKKLEANPFYDEKSEKEKAAYNKMLQRGNWRSKGWAEIARDAGFSELNSKIIYSFLCEHAHSGNISVTQVRQSPDFSIRRSLMGASIGHLIICTANMIKHYCDYFDKSREYYQEKYPEPNIVDMWIDIGASKN